MFTKQSKTMQSFLGLCAATLLVGPAVAGAAPGLGQFETKQPIDAGGTLDFPTGETRPLELSSGLVINADSRSAVVFDELVRAPGAAWVRLYFSEVRLQKGSTLRVTSLLDGESQELDADGIAMWQNSTAYFNGDAVRIELIAAPFSTDNMITLREYAYETGVADRGGCGICGNDDRVPSSDNNFARLSPVGCSATLYNEESCMVTAGHCLGQGGVVQFNVPSSNSDGSTNNPPVADQFPVLAEQGVDGGVGADYGALRIGTNGSGQTPYDRFGTFMPLASSVPNSGTVEIRGYGVDENDPTRSQTQQFHDGPIVSLGGTSIEYDVDVTFGNSGSSIIANGQIIGVVTHCSSSCVNYGNRIDDPAFEQVRGIICNGDEPPDGCPIGEIEDCNGNCCPADWVGDGYCDDGSYSHNGVAIFLNCDAFDCDSGDCPAESCDGGGGGGATGACCIGTQCSDGLSSDDCSAFGGTYQGDDSSCNSVDCGGGGGGECPDGWSEDCQGTCFPNEVFDAWLGDTYCDDGSYIPFDYGCTECPEGVAMFLNCDEFNCDNGDCPEESCGGGGGGGTGACCIGTQCSDGLSSDDCSAFGGTYQGDDSSCNSVDCGGGGGGGDGDTCADAAVADLGGNAFDTSQNSDSGFGEPDASQCDGTFLDWASSPDFWFRWTAPGDGTVSFSTCDASSYDTSLVLYRGDDCGNLQQIACNGDAADSSGCQEYHSQIDGVSVGSGEMYYVRIGGWNAATGSGTLTIDGSFDKPQQGACCIGFECIQASLADCNVLEGEFQGTGSSCNTPDICGVPDCEGDANGDGQINVNDLLGVIGEWGCSAACDYDVTGDGQVNVSDVLMVIGAWGPCL